MANENDLVDDFEILIDSLYKAIILGNIPDNAFYRAFVSQETEFALDENGYQKTYWDLLNRVFAIPKISDMWSEDSVQDLGHNLMVELARDKYQGSKPPDLRRIAQEFLKKINVGFEELSCFGVVSGLIVSSPLQVGDVTFFPAGRDIAELNGLLSEQFLKDLNISRDSISYSKVTAEWRRASEIHRERTESALNVIRFIASMMWHDQPTHHVYIQGLEPERVSNTLVISLNGKVSNVGASEYIPHPIDLTTEMLPHADFYGFSQIQSLLKKPEPSQIEKSLLTAILWFGQATQEPQPLIAFIKYHIAIEVVLKKHDESAKSVLPKRIAVLLYLWDKRRVEKLEAELKDYFNERNSVFHSGSPISRTPELLQMNSRIISRQVLHQLRLKINSEKWQTLDDLIAWVKKQSKK